ncbi:hypothetical protein PMKS-000202 [Pichia membranifaciens]|uniref:Uncharacterized protein n=1 Tax=Pichia membranifaciens TaxID=4926 RepID=A0A1Q2YB15_9ASCO|nr:hypothetical protein PMKS-000202 [Pichia membranifaciens]
MSHTRGSEMTLEQLRALGNEKFRALNYGAALMHYTQAIDQDPSSFAIYYNRAITLVKMDAMKEAKEDLLRSLEINPEYIPSLCQLAFIYLYEGNTPDSLETYVKVVKLNQELPHQLNRFKAQLKEAVRLAESRCKQQEYPQDFIDSIITPDIRESLDLYPNLPTHMIESGIPPVAFGNVPISHQFENASAVIARASIPIPVTGIRAMTTTATNSNNNNSNTNDATANGNTNNNPANENVANVLNIPGLLNALNTPGVSASVSIGGPQSSEELLNALGNFTNTQLSPEAANANSTGTSAYSGPSTPNVSTSASATTSTTPTIIHAPVSRTTSGLPTDVLQRHREAHQAALNRAAELRRQREQGLGNSTTDQASTENQAADSNVDSNVNSNEDTNTSTSTNSTATATTGSDFARQFASTIAAQLTNAAVQNASQSGTNATPNSGAIQSLAQNLTSIASGVLGSLSSGNNFVSMVSNGNGYENSNSNGNNGSSSENPLDADLDMDLD